MDLSEILKLSVEERLELMAQIWNTIPSVEEMTAEEKICLIEVVLDSVRSASNRHRETPAQLAELERRLALSRTSAVGLEPAKEAIERIFRKSWTSS